MTTSSTDRVLRGKQLRDALMMARHVLAEAEERLAFASSQRQIAQEQVDAALRAIQQFNASLRVSRPSATQPVSDAAPNAKKKPDKQKPTREACATCGRMLVPTKSGALPAHSPTKKSTSWCKGGKSPKPRRMTYVDAMDRLSFYKIRS